MLKQLTILFILIFFVMPVSSQVYTHVDHQSVYEFLDEMASLSLIELNSAVKPYSRTMIAGKLETVWQQRSSLNTRQYKELVFLLRDYQKELDTTYTKKRLDLYHFRDSVFNFTVNLLGGGDFYNNGRDNLYHRWAGVEAFAYAGEHIAVYANFRDNYESAQFSKEQFLNTRHGVNYKSSKNNGEYSDARGGISYWWKWGNIALVKDHLEWGNYLKYPSIFSAKAPSFAQLKLNMAPVHWFEFNYFHGWLVSEMVDSVKSYSYVNTYGTGNRNIMREKFVASNLFTFKPMKRLYLSFGNSIIYGDYIRPVFFIPFLFYKSVDHTLNATDKIASNIGQNSQLFLDFSSRQIKHLHVFATIFVDEFSVKRLSDERLNFVSYKGGFRVHDLVPNSYFSAEYYRCNPLVYKHNIPITTYESNGYNLGHYLQDNSEEFFADLGYKPLKNLLLSLSASWARKGKDYTALGVPRDGNPFIDSVQWESLVIEGRFRYQFINDIYVFGGIQLPSLTSIEPAYTPAFFAEDQPILRVGVNVSY